MLSNVEYVPCGVCGHPPARLYSAKEKMLALGDDFLYSTCSRCGAIQITSAPQEIERYYPRQYYSFSSPLRATGGPLRKARTILKRVRRSAYRSEQPGLAARLLMSLRPDWLTKSLRHLDPSTARILDIGSGSGGLLLELHRAGFGHLWGIDPYLPASEKRTEFTLLKTDIFHFEGGEFDAVILNHSLEHMHNQLGVFARIRDLIAPRGICIIRTPLADSFACARYDADWVQHDPPRHLFLHTRESLRIAASKARLTIIGAEDDSTGFQFWGSELIRRGVPLAPAWQVRDLHPKLLLRFYPWELIRFRLASKRLNRAGQGDQGIFTLAPTTPLAAPQPHPPTIAGH